MLLKCLMKPASRQLLQFNRRLIATSVRLNEIVKVQDMKDFEKYVALKDKPVLLDFYATWCQPCKILTPRIENLMKEYQDKLVFVKVDIGPLSDAAMNYEVFAVPTVIGIKNGKERNRFTGVQEEADIRKFIDDLLL